MVTESEKGQLKKKEEKRPFSREDSFQSSQKFLEKQRRRKMLS